MSNQSPDNDQTVIRPSSDPHATEYFGNSGGMGASAFSPGFVMAGKFRLECQLGRGGMGEAWKAFDTLAERPVVLKFVPKEIQHVKEAMDSVKDSFKKVHGLQHQHICPVYDLFQDEQHGLCLVMKYIDGMPLDEYKRKQIEKTGKMSFSDSVQILWGIAKGLDYAHEKKVIHRDIKPQNVMISKKDGVQIIDFGLAEEIRTSMAQFSEVAMEVSGTRPYMAPEQWRGRLQDARTDQYALAVTAYELFAGHPPFRGSDVGVLRECVLNDEPEPIPGLSEHVNAALSQALAKKREDRFSDCKSFVRALAEKPKAETIDDDLVPDQKPVEVSAVQTLHSDPNPSQTQALSWRPTMSTDVPGSVSSRTDRKKNVWISILIIVPIALMILGLVIAFNLKPSSHALQPEPDTVKSETPETGPAGVQSDLSVLTDDENSHLRQKYSEFDWTNANIVVLTEPTESGLRQAFQKAAETKESDFIVVRTTKDKYRIVLYDGSFDLGHKASEKGSITIIALGPEKLILDGAERDRIFIVRNGAEACFGAIVFTNGFLIDNQGAAVYVSGRSTASFFDCVLTANVCKPDKKNQWWAGFGGAGIAAEKNSFIILRDTLFEENRISYPEVSEKANGGKIYWDSSAGLLLKGGCSLVATNVVFRNNHGGGAFIHQAKSVEMRNISLIDNKSLGSGTIHLHGDDADQTYRITNLFATGNSSGEFGGALQVGGKGRYVLDHLTLVGNNGNVGGGLCFGGGSDNEIHATEVVLSNSIIVGNRGKFVSDFAVSHVKVEKFDLFNNITSEGIATEQKRFSQGRNNRFLKLEDVKLGELKSFGNGIPIMPLLEGSPAIDSGIATETTPETDITGRSRSVGTAPDIGAFEWQQNSLAQ